MGYTSPAAVVSGAVISKTTFGDVVKADLDFLANAPACRVYHNTTQALANNTRIALAFNSEQFDNDTMHDTVTNNTRITIKTAGVYMITAHVEFPADNDLTALDWSIRRNGTLFIAYNDEQNPGTANVVRARSIATLYKLAVNDYIEFLVRQVNTSAGSMTLAASSGYAPEFGAAWVSLG